MPNAKQQARKTARSVLDLLGYSYRASGEAERDTLWWLSARVAALRARRGLLRGWAVAWTSSGYAELVPFDVARPGRGELTVELHASAVSPGTERAQYLRLPNAKVGPSTRPGYSAAGVVLETGRGVTDLAAGDRVAAIETAHASIATLREEQALRVPDRVPLEQAALARLGVIARHGAAVAGIAPGERFCVLGAGLIGALTQRLLVAAGGDCAAVVARSRAGEEIARAGQAGRFLVAAEDADEIAALAVAVVVEATGDPDAINLALAAAGENGRVILLGSPRGITHALDVDRMRAHGLTAIGAHVDMVKRESPEAERRHAQAFLDALERREIAVDDLVGSAVDPRDAGRFYRELAAGRGPATAWFDWTLVDDRPSARPVSPLRPPNLAGAGMDAHRLPLRPRGRRGPELLTLPDPFANAAGRLRIGILGCGDIAAENAAAAVAAPNVELTAAYDPVGWLAEDIATRFGGEACPSTEALAARDDVDAVLISVPHDLHAPLAAEAARAGKHVIVEKPPANNLGAAREMVSIGEAAGVVVSVCFPQRFESRVAVARRLVRAGALGELGGVAVELLLDRPPGYWAGGFSGRSRSDWRLSRERAGGGVLAMNLSHYLDLLRHLTGVDVEEVAAVARQPVGAEVEDTIVVSGRFDNGAVVSLVAGAAVPGAERASLRLWGRDGHVAVEPEGRFYTLAPLPELRSNRWQALGPLPRRNPRAIFLSRLATAIHEGREPDVTADDALSVQALIEAVYLAVDGRASVRPAELLRETASA